MRWTLLLALSALPAAASEFASEFASAPAWQMACRLTPEARADGWCIDAVLCPPQDYKVTWHRDRGEARIIWQGDAGKGMAEIGGFATASGQHIAHFTFSPATATYGSDAEGLIGIDPGFFSVRFSGEAALTYHSVLYGGVEPLSATGTCDIQPLDAKEE